MWWTIRSPWIAPCPEVDLTPRRPALTEADVKPGMAFHALREAIALIDEGAANTLGEAVGKLDETGWPAKPRPDPPTKEPPEEAANSPDMWGFFPEEPEEKPNWRGPIWYASQEKAVIDALNKLSEALEKAREAARMPDPQVVTVKDFNTLLPYLSPTRGFARAFTVSAYWKVHKKDYTGAVADLESAIRIGNLVSRGGGLINQLVDVACTAIACKALWNIDVKYGLPAEALQQMLDTLLEIEENLDPVGETFRYEALMLLNTVDLIYRKGPAAFWSMSGGPSGRAKSFYTPALGLFTGFLVGSTPTITKRNLGYCYANLIRLAERPYDPKAMAAFEASFAVGRNPVKILLARDPFGLILAGMLLPSLSRALNKTRLRQGMLRATCAYLALRLREHADGKVPADLAELVPAYLPSVPTDPFDGKPLRFKMEADGTWKVYSVGEDEKDDGGAASSWFNMYSRARGSQRKNNPDLVIPGQLFPAEKH